MAKTTKKAPKAKKQPKARGESIRLRGFKLLAKGELTGAQVKEGLGTSGIPNLLKDEALCKPPRIARNTDKGPTLYSLTAAGRKALDEGTVDSDAAARSVGQR